MLCEIVLFSHGMVLFSVPGLIEAVCARELEVSKSRAECPDAGRSAGLAQHGHQRGQPGSGAAQPPERRATVSVNTPRDRDREEWLTVYYVEPSHCNLCGDVGT